MFFAKLSQTEQKKSTHVYDQETGTQEEIYNNIKK
jgi:hypothetical protein